MAYQTGWLKDLPDQRDYSDKTPEVEEIIQSIKGLAGPEGTGIPSKIDLSNWCSDVEQQGQLGSCTAHAGVALLEYFTRRSDHKEIFEGSRLFLYKITRKLMNWPGDKGAYLRSTMGAMKLFGIPPEKYYPYIEEKFDNEPDAFIYALAQNYKADHYFRLDPPDISPGDVLNNVKKYLAAGFPSMFGFTLYSSYMQAKDNAGKIPFPALNEPVRGGHAVVAVGYDDELIINNMIDGSQTTGALKIRNSWGKEWGEQGYGWLPYEYVKTRQALDFWTLISAKYAGSNEFGF